MTGKPKTKVDDLFSFDERIDLTLLDRGVNFLVGEIDENNITKIIKWIIFENLKQSDEILTLYINSDGGSLQDAFALIDIMLNSKRVIRTVGLGSICSAAFLIFASGTNGQRYISKNTSIMCHQFSDGFDGKYHDIKSAQKEYENTNHRMVELLKTATGLETKTIKTKLLPPSDVWFVAEELIEYGVADHIF